MRILVDIPTPDDFNERVRDIQSDVEITHARSGEPAFEEALPEAEIMLGIPPLDDVRRAERLEWLQLSSAGANRYVGKIPEDILLTNASGVFGVPAAEHAFAMMLAHARSIPKSIRDQQHRAWDPGGTCGELYGTTCGILGAGDIGRAVADRAYSFGMRVVAVRRNPSERSEGVAQMYGPEGLDEMLATCDHVVNTLPETAETHHLIDAGRLRAMKKGSYFYNVGRGGTVDEQALVEALQNGHLAGAGLDVFEEEPLPDDSPLWDMPNVIITPHEGGASPNLDERIAAVFLENLRRRENGELLKNVVDPELGY